MSWSGHVLTLQGCHVTVTSSGRAAQLAAALGAHNVIAVTEEDGPGGVAARLARAGPYNLIVQCGDSPGPAHLAPLLTPGTRLTSTLPTSLPSDGWGYLGRALHPLWRALILSPPQSFKCGDLLTVQPLFLSPNL